LTPTYTVHAGNPRQADVQTILNYHPDMEYRRCGKTNLMVSAVCLGGHWKRLNGVLPGLFQEGDWLGAKLDDPNFEQNRRDLVSRCIDRGFNYIDACTGEEVLMYAKTLKGRRDQMYLGYSSYQHEMRQPEWQTFDQLKQGFDAGLQEAGLDYVDLWRVTCHEQSSRHTQPEIDELIKALAWAKKTGRARFTGISSHDRPHIRQLIERYPDQLDVIVTPYTSMTKVVTDADGLWAAMTKFDIGWFGIKPYSSGSLFKGDGTPGNPEEEGDHRLARLALRYILCNPAITAPIPGMITTAQVDNAALAVKERRQLDSGELAELDWANRRAWATLPPEYQWLKTWQYV
ncbi:MAG: hypothetical protein A2W31_05330, partial [Planctomycetes bacterium RBG_16_64_10]